jgi:CheY-like chemotaxis protein
MSTARAHARPRRLLVVDDDCDAADTLRILLELNGDRAHAAYSGESAFELARRVHPDVILCDIGMPRMNGHQLAAAVRADPELRDVRLVAMTGLATEQDARQSHASGFDLHLVKPLPWADICSALDLLESR